MINQHVIPSVKAADLAELLPGLKEAAAAVAAGAHALHDAEARFLPPLPLRDICFSVLCFPGCLTRRVSLNRRESCRSRRPRRACCAWRP